MTQDIIVTIGPDGQTTVEVAGVCGSGCSALTAALERALGSTTADTKTADYYRPATQALRQGGGR
jgi:hypothetical protein